MAEDGLLIQSAGAPAPRRMVTGAAGVSFAADVSFVT